MPVNTIESVTSGLMRAMDVFLAPVDRIEVSPFQAREFFDEEKLEELADDIHEKGGVLHPILLRPHPKREGWFQLVAGERRWRATKLRFGQFIRATVRDWNDIEAAEIGLQENFKDESLTDFEEAKGIRNLWEMYAKQGAEYNDTQFARKIKQSLTFVTNCWKILKLDDDLLELAKKRRQVKSSLIAISKVKDSTRRGIYKEMVKAGDSFEKVTNAISRDDLKAKEQEAIKKGTDSETKERSEAFSKGENSSVSRGQRVKGPKPLSESEQETMLREIQIQYIHALSKVNDRVYERVAKPFAREIIRGELAR